MALCCIQHKFRFGQPETAFFSAHKIFITLFCLALAMILCEALLRYTWVARAHLFFEI